MNESIFITGVAGTGKSTICKELSKRGFISYDLEKIPGLFAMYDKITHKKIQHTQMNNMENVAKLEWLCDIDALKDLMDKNIGHTTYYCGVGTNIHEIINLFDRLIMLKTNNNELDKRLASRGEGSYAYEPDVRKHLFLWKDNWEKEIGGLADKIIQTDQDMESIIDSIAATM